MTDKEIALRLTEAAFRFAGDIKHPSVDPIVTEIKVYYLRMLKDIQGVVESGIEERIDEIIERYNHEHS